MKLALVAGLATISFAALPSRASAQTAESRPIAPSHEVLLASARLRSRPADLVGIDPSARALVPQQATGNKRQGEILMLVGAAGIVTGLLVDEDIVTIAGAGVGGFGLYLYLQGTR
jgi:hypothetical protein